MTEPARRTSRTTTSTATARPSGDDAPDARPADSATPLVRRIDDPVAQRRRRPLRGGGAVYQQIAAEIRASIESGDLAPGAAIPSEAQMMQEYGVSRPTVRNAIAALRSAGLLVVQRGRATTVRDTIAATSGARLDFDPAIIRSKRKSTPAFRTWDSDGWDDAEDPSRYRTEAAHLANALHLAATEPVFVLDRQLTHTETGTEVSYRLTIPFATVADVPALTDDPFRPAADLYQVITDLGTELHWHDSITTAMPSPDEAAALDLPDGVPLLIHTRVTLDGTDRVLLHEETRLPGDRVSVTARPPVR